MSNKIRTIFMLISCLLLLITVICAPIGAGFVITQMLGGKLMYNIIIAGCVYYGTIISWVVFECKHASGL